MKQHLFLLILGFLFIHFSSKLQAQTPQEQDLLSAALDNNLVKVQALIKAGVNVNAKTKDGLTSLMQASQDGRIAIVQALIKAGADVNAKHEPDMNALMKALRYIYTEGLQVIIDQEAYVKTKDKQKLLENTSVRERLQKVIDYLSHEVNVLDLERVISMKTQRYTHSAM